MQIKPTELAIKNIGKIAEMTIPINKPLILFYGEIRQGKSTILNAVRWVCGGEFPDDIIRHGEKEGSIELRFDGGMIGRSFYRAKDQKTKARPVTFVRNGKPVASPVSEIKRFLNPFLLDQDFLRNKSELERKQYFTELFAVDTTELDTELFNSEAEASKLRVKIGAYGDIDLTKVEPVDTAVLKNELAGYRAVNDATVEAFNKLSASVREHNMTVIRSKDTRAVIAQEVVELETKLTALKTRLDKADEWLAANPPKEQPEKPELKATDALEARIQDAGAVNVRAEQYRANKARAEAKKADETALLAREKRQREIKVEKQAKLKSVSDSCGIAGLEFDDAGNFIYQGTTAGMISDSQIMRLSSELSALYPDGMGVQILDRAESLGRTVFDYVEFAKSKNVTVMATIVGQAPASAPERVGVYVVKDGVVFPAEAQ